jgi:hypothetical protein
MPLTWPVLQYERTCADCGHTWRVPRRFARKRLLSMPGVVGGSRLILGSTYPYQGPAAADLAAGMRIGTEFDAHRTCQECGSRHYSQRRALVLRRDQGTVSG